MCAFSLGWHLNVNNNHVNRYKSKFYVKHVLQSFLKKRILFLKFFNIEESISFH